MPLALKISQISQLWRHFIVNKPNPWTFAGQEAIREQEAHKMSFIEKCRVHDQLWENAKLFMNTKEIAKQREWTKAS